MMGGRAGEFRRRYFDEETFFQHGELEAIVPAPPAPYPPPARREPWQIEAPAIPEGWHRQIEPGPWHGNPTVFLTLDLGEAPITAGRLIAELGKLPANTLVQFSDSEYGFETVTCLQLHMKNGRASVVLL